MKLEFDTLLIDQFKSFVGRPHELDLLSYGIGVHFVRGSNLFRPRLGSNGAGKSTLWDALCWALYGRTAEELRNPDIQARFGKKATTVAVSVLIDGAKHTIQRTTHPNRLTLDGEDTGQEQIDGLIGLDFNTFTNTILLGQGRPLFYDLGPKAKLDLFSSVLDLDRWERRAKVAADEANKLEVSEVELAANANLSKAELTRTAARLTSVTNAWRGWRDEQEAEVQRRQVAIAELQAKLEQKERERGGYDLQYDGALTELKAEQSSIQVLAKAREELIFTRSKHHGEKRALEQQEVQYAEEFKLLGNSNECPICGQSLKGTKLAKHKKELGQKLRECSRNVGKHEEIIETLTNKITENQNKLKQARQFELQFKQKAEDARDAKDRLTPHVEEMKARIKQLKLDQKSNEKRANPYTEQVNQLRKEAKKLEAEHKEAMRLLGLLHTKIERVRFWVKGFKEVQLYELEDVLQELELVTNAATAEVGLLDWKVRYVVEKETKKGTIQRGLNVFIQGPDDTAPVKWECWSGGERQRLRVIGAQALSEVLLARAGVEPTMEILDEPTQHISPEGIEDLCDMLAERARMLRRQIWYCDQQSVDSVRFTSTLTVVKDKYGSKLEAEG